MKNLSTVTIFFILNAVIAIVFGSLTTFAEDEGEVFIPFSSGNTADQNQDNKKEESRQKKINKTLNISGPIFDQALLGYELGVELKNLNLHLGDLFKGFNDFSSFQSIKSRPRTRAETLGHKDDLLHQRGLQIQINNGQIHKRVFILSDTGHDIPIAAQLLKNKELNAQTFFYFPKAILESSGTNDRIIHQAQSWAQDIHYYQTESVKTVPEVIFVGLEGHRREYDKSFLYEIPWHKLPTNTQLLKLGIEKVVYITEAHPSNLDVKNKVLKDIQAYLKTLSLPISYLGVDCRREEGC